MLLSRHEITLVIVLSIQSSSHFQFPSVIAHISISFELIRQLLLTHVLFDVINNAHDIIDVSFKLFTFFE